MTLAAADAAAAAAAALLDGPPAACMRDKAPARCSDAKCARLQTMGFPSYSQMKAPHTNVLTHVAPLSSELIERCGAAEEDAQRGDNDGSRPNTRSILEADLDNKEEQF